MTFPLGVAVGAGTFLLIAVAGEIPLFTDGPFCEAKESVLTCTREWANAFAIFTGAIVIAVTIAGQKAEAQRHFETVRMARAPETLRVSRALYVTDRLKAAIASLQNTIELVGPGKETDRIDGKALVAPYGEAFDSILAAIRADEIKNIRELFDKDGTAAYRNALSAAEKAQEQLFIFSQHTISKFNKNIMPFRITSEQAMLNRMQFVAVAANLSTRAYDLVEEVDRLAKDLNA
ncbi:hypothetical protein [Aureimonas ureilytica]|nr:hypothetical protein [Aureimonas ureilytica]